MSERVKAYFEKLENLSSEELDRAAKELALSEKQSVARLIAHIAEIGARKYYLELGYTSLFEYWCGSTQARVQSTGKLKFQACAADFPKSLRRFHAAACTSPRRVLSRRTSRRIMWRVLSPSQIRGYLALFI